MAIIGAILGDIVGSHYEFRGQRPKDFDHNSSPFFTEGNKFTDDTVLSIATKAAIIDNPDNPNFAKFYKEFGNKYMFVGYGGRFRQWLLLDEQKSYGSFGNGSAMRVSYVADHYDSLEDVIKYATMSAECTHDHPEGIKGAIVTAGCIWCAKHGLNKNKIYEYAIEQYPKDKYRFSPELSLDDIKDKYRWNDICQDSVPVAIRCVLEADSYSEFIRNCYMLDCDTDTICAIGGAIAEELYTNNDTDELMSNAKFTLQKYLDEYLYNYVFNMK